jgi:hypothetical protein
MDVQCMHLYNWVGHTWLVVLYMEIICCTVHACILSIHARIPDGPDHACTQGWDMSGIELYVHTYMQNCMYMWGREPGGLRAASARTRVGKGNGKQPRERPFCGACPTSWMKEERKIKLKTGDLQGSSHLLDPAWCKQRQDAMRTHWVRSHPLAPTNIRGHMQLQVA